MPLINFARLETGPRHVTSVSPTSNPVASARLGVTVNLSVACWTVRASAFDDDAVTVPPRWGSPHDTDSTGPRQAD